MLLTYSQSGVTKQIEVNDIGDLIDEFGQQNVVEALVDLHGQDDDDLFDLLVIMTDDAWED